MSTKYDSDDPEVIEAKAKARAMTLEARAKLTPAAQVLYTFLDGVDTIIQSVGCLFILAVVLIAIFAPQLFTLIRGIFVH